MQLVEAEPISGAELVRGRKALAKLGDVLSKALPSRLPARTSYVPAIFIEPSDTDPLAVAQAHAALHRQLWEMYDTDPTVGVALDMMGSMAARRNRNGRSFEITFRVDRTAPQGVKKATRDLTTSIDKMLDRRHPKPGVSLRRRAGTMMKLAVLGGERHFEPVIDWDAETIIQGRYLRGPREYAYLRRLFDDDGQLVGYAHFDLRRGTKVPVRLLAPWQVASMVWNDLCHDGSEGRGQFHSARVVWQRLQDMERDLATARRERAFMKLVHVYQGLGEDKLLEKQTRMLELRKRYPRGVLTDLYTGGKIDVIDPSNAQLSRIGDVIFVLQILMDAGRAPKGLRPGYGEDVNRATLDRGIEIAYDCANDIRDMAAQMIEALVDIEMVLLGANPEDWPYDVVWSPLSIETELEKMQRHVLAVNSRVYSKAQARREQGVDHGLMETEIEEDAAADAGGTLERPMGSEIAAMEAESRSDVERILSELAQRRASDEAEAARVRRAVGDEGA